MKILGGKFKNRNFFMPKDIRPTQNIVRKALFDILGQELTGLTFLDLFSGSGAIGIEAISRGAQKTVFVEKDIRNFDVLQQNIKLLPIEMEEQGLLPYVLFNTDAFMAIKMFAHKSEKFDIIFFDPPYGDAFGKKLLKTIEAYDILHPNSVIVAEHLRREILPDKEGRIYLFKQKKYGNTVLSFYKIDEN
ncbi:MAG TPA: 16S rRNA (guanine(966)-N(2))-methyltransferase RsmD [Candidatus Omnitrophota bacterium]|nr:16S rRNA (guanine(966)-N(2))-methyltransferase RsmD [Candidatus Omnitrophota bacterium]